jgi:hypothetical protein
LLSAPLRVRGSWLMVINPGRVKGDLDCYVGADQAGIRKLTSAKAKSQTFKHKGPSHFCVIISHR